MGEADDREVDDPAVRIRLQVTAIARISRAFPVDEEAKRPDSIQFVEVLGGVAGLAAADAEIGHRVAGDDPLGVHDPAAERSRQVRQHPGDIGALGEAVERGPTVASAPSTPGIAWQEPQP
jgi:hypothetical protein